MLLILFLLFLQYLGTWWEYEKYPFIFEVGGKCIRAEYGKAADGDVTVRNEQLFFNSKRSVKGTAKVVGDGKLTVTFDLGLISPSSPYWVLSTDYQNYAVVYSCNSKSLFHTSEGNHGNNIKNLLLIYYDSLCRSNLDLNPCTCPQSRDR